ncbi:MAG: hypothetical protein IH917_14575, partial [Acidobacteria bacterium]|nr:hypothetical protein [Acidobacteriota bacterium]
NWTVVHRILYTQARMMGRPSWVIAPGKQERKEGDRREETGERREEREGNVSVEMP